MRRRPATVPLIIGATFLGGVLLTVVAGHVLVSPDSTAMFSAVPNLPPDAAHPLGTQSQGRDMLAVMAAAIPATLFVSLLGGGVAVIIGTILGMTAGYFGGVVDGIIRTAVDVALTIPTLAVLILIGASFPVVSLSAMGFIIALTAWMGPARVVRAQVLTLREREFVRIAKLSGLGGFRIIALELLPNLIPFLSAIFVNAVVTATAATIGLEVLGLGPRQTITLGNTIFEALYYTAMWRGMWWWWAPPVIVLVCLFQGLFFIGKALDSIANPRALGATT